MTDAVAALRASTDIGAGVERQAIFIPAEINANANGSAVAFVFTLKNRGVLRRQQVDVTGGSQAEILAGLQLAALNGDIRVGGANIEVVSGGERAALALVRGLRLLRF